METLKILRQKYADIPVVIVSNKAEIRRAIDCVRLGAFDFVDKAEAGNELPIVVGNALRLRNLEVRTASLEAQNQLYRQEEERRYGLGQIIGGSDAMQRIYRIIERVAPTDAAVLITGETGTGKELVAGALHYLGLKKDGPFIKVNCAALPETLLEAELFGHEKGAFTGATERRMGRFELAHNGTIFLDEIGDMSLTTQAKVLRILQEKEFERVGGNRPVRVEVRVVSATNRDLGALIEQGLFREDLYYRLNDFVIELPPLRERRDDIPLLVQAFLEEFADKYTGRRVTPGVTKALMRYDWPGNVRELKKVLMNAAIMATSETIRFEDLPPVVLKPGDK
jgi:DNA-binding NtrC family response regulator